MTFLELLKFMVKRHASDLFITADAPPAIKVNGTVKPWGNKALSEETATAVIMSAMNDLQKREYEEECECSFALNQPNLGRFRISVYQQRSMPAMVVRRIQGFIPSLGDLKLPATLKELVMAKHGLVLVVGSTSSGKSTTLASLIDYRNQNKTGHIITIEDPVEFIHTHKKSIIAQREVGIDTPSFAKALKSALRQAPDVILMGEIRDAELMQHALAFAETGHLCLATLHANNASQALDRILSFFPVEQHNQVWMDLSFNLRGIVAQMLLPTVGDVSRRVAVEVMTCTPVIKELIRKGDVHSIKDIMKASGDAGMQTFDQALFELFSDGIISYDTAMSHANSENDLRLMIELSDSSISLNETGSDTDTQDSIFRKRKLPLAAELSSEPKSVSLSGVTLLPPDHSTEPAPLYAYREPKVEGEFNFLPADDDEEK
nr:PilT/PilU family type 4a pilus ATPase [Marinobacterium stanieri]